MHMMALHLSRYALSICMAAVLVAGCGGSQSQIGGPAAIPQGARRAEPGAKRCPTSTCIYVADPRDADGTITVYPANATGNVAPYRTISGLYNVYGVAVDQVGRTYVEQQLENKVSVYGASAHGNVPPLFTIAGPRTRIGFPAGIVLDSAGRLHVLSVPHSSGRVTTYRAGAKGDAHPINTIQGPATKMKDPFLIGVDNSGNTYVTTERSCSTACYGKNAILIYAAGTDGNAHPTWTIRGSNTQLSPAGPGAVALDSSGNVYTLVLNDPASVNVYAAGAHGNVAPIRVIAGSNTGLGVPDGIFVDASGKIYVTNIYPRVSVIVFAAGSTGNVAPIQTISGKKTRLSYPQGIVVR